MTVFVLKALFFGLFLGGLYLRYFTNFIGSGGDFKWRVYQWGIRPATASSLMTAGFINETTTDFTLIQMNFAIWFIASAIFFNISDRVLEWAGLRGFFAGLTFGKDRGSSGNRGANLGTAKELNKLVKKREPGSKLLIGDVYIPESAEPLHFMFSGATGSGKTQAFHQILTYARDRGDRAVLADLGGEFASQYYRHGVDFILNPFDGRMMEWSPFAEMRAPYDAERIAASMVPEGKGDQREWNGYARTLLEGILERLWSRGDATNQALCYYSLAAPVDEIRILLDGTAASAYLADGADRMLGSIRGILSSYIKPYTYLNPEAGADYNTTFSIREVLEFDGGRWLFITYLDDQLQAMRPLIATWLDIAASCVLSSQPDQTRPIWFAFDEFSSLGYLNSIEPLLTKGRKYGARCVLGYQSVSQAQDTYGEKKAQTLFANLSTWLVLRQPDAQSAEYMAKFIGDEEFRRYVESSSSGPSGSSSGVSEQQGRQTAIIPRELQNLADRVGVLQLVGGYPAAVAGIPIHQGVATEDRFMQAVPPVQAMRLTRPAGAPITPPKSAQTAAPAPARTDFSDI